MDATSPLYLPRNHTLYGAQGTCLELHVITDGEWEYNWDTGGSRLRITDSEPAKCNLPSRDIERLITERTGNCDKYYDPCPF